MKQHKNMQCLCLTLITYFFFCTILFGCRYLSDVEEGGETAFPEGSIWNDPSIPQRLEEAG